MIEDKSAHPTIDKQERFLEVFFEECYKGSSYYDAGKAAFNAAGYSNEYSVRTVLKNLKDKILERSQEHLIWSLPKTLAKMDGVMDDPNDSGGKRILEVATMILDRAGLVKKEQSEVEFKIPDGIAILPSKVPVGKE